jgi:hypothetical protein
VATVACDRMERYFSAMFDDLRDGLLQAPCKWGSLHG